METAPREHDVMTEAPPRKDGRSHALTLPERLARSLSAAASGLPNVFDESTDFFHPFWVQPAPGAGETLTPAAFGLAAGIDPHYHVDSRNAEDLFDAAKEYGDPNVEAGYALVRTLMGATLSNLTVAFARKSGVVRVRMWLFGQLDGGALVGLKSEVTET